MAKKRIVLDYEKLPEEIVNRIKVEYAEGYEENLVTFTNAEGRFVSALPFETEEIYYLIRMTEGEAKQIVQDDDDFGDDGKLREGFSEDMETEEGQVKKEYLDENFDEAASIKDEPYEE